jgi:hypothetical protein
MSRTNDPRLMTRRIDVVVERGSSRGGRYEISSTLVAVTALRSQLAS